MFRLEPRNEDPATVADGLQDAAVGDRVTFAEEKHAYAIRAISTDRRWMICTKPFNLQRTVLYCVLDRREQRRGPDDRVFGPAYETDEDVAFAMHNFEHNGWGVTVRRDVRINVVAVKRGRESVWSASQESTARGGATDVA